MGLNLRVRAVAVLLLVVGGVLYVGLLLVRLGVLWCVGAVVGVGDGRRHVIWCTASGRVVMRVVRYFHGGNRVRGV